MWRMFLAAFAVLAVVASSSCPFAHSGGSGAAGADIARFSSDAFHAIDFEAVKRDIAIALTTSKNAWPADFGNYGPLIIRVAWHCAGTYRVWDGRGGCDGGRQRFDPERSWPDNTNTDKGRAILMPIKLKYGPGLSWADLIILAGNVAIETMGGPILGFCAGRLDDGDGKDSLPLGPSAEQESLMPCPDPNNCSYPLGQNVMGNIYVNPQGPQGNPDPALSALDIREVFGRMGMNDAETVALIGAHAFGKTHGACPTGPGPSPMEDPTNPWPGTCGTGPATGKGNNTYTSGFEGAWTNAPTTWGTDYFNNLLEYDWALHMGPGAKYQWLPTNKSVPDIMMLTTDVALTKDPVYLELVKQYARNITKLNAAFSHAWYKLTTRDMGPVTRCLGKDVPPAQSFQNPLPPPPSPLPDFRKVRRQIQKALTSRSRVPIKPDTYKGKPYYGTLFATLAWQCARTFRVTDYLGGCNGAAIRFSPEKDWPLNAHMDSVLQVLQPVKDMFRDSLSYADLIVLAGQTALEEAGGKKMKFCGGRSDAMDGKSSEFLAPRNYSDVILEVTDTLKVMGLSRREMVALYGNLRSPEQQKRLGYSGSWTSDPGALNNKYFIVLLTEDWQRAMSAAGREEYTALGRERKGAGLQQLYMTPLDMVLRWEPSLSAVAQEYASDNRAFLAEFASAWTKMMNADRFDGPVGNVCDKPR